MSDTMKIGLVGAGVFAGYHANKLSEHPRVSFVGVHDPDRPRACALAEKHGVEVMDADALHAACDAMVIACPASFHGEMAIRALEADCHCLIEKPLAVTVGDAERIVGISKKKSLVVQVGHQERMVLKAIGLLDVEEVPLAVNAVRSSPYSSRGTDTSVTMDLMTHDIDICTALFGRAPDSVSGQSRPVKSKTADEANAVLTYGYARAKLSASRVVETGERHMTVTYPSGTVKIDFNAKTLVNATDHDLNARFGDSDLAKDSLGAATKSFIAAILDKTPVMVSAEEGLIAVRTAAEVDGEMI